jgi:hypothetical protein
VTSAPDAPDARSPSAAALRLRIRRALLPFLVAGLVVGLVATAVASWRRTDVKDPNDRPGVLDVRTVRFWHPRGEPPEWTVLTFDDWKPRQLWDHGYVHLFIDTKGGEVPEYRVLVRSSGRGLLGSLWRIPKRPRRTDRFVRELTVWRKSRDGVSVAVPLKRMRFGQDRKMYSWWAVTTLTSEKCPYTCIDRVPGKGAVPQWRPGMSPSSSPSPG